MFVLIFMAKIPLVLDFASPATDTPRDCMLRTIRFRKGTIRLQMIDNEGNVGRTGTARAAGDSGKVLNLNVKA